MQLECDISGVDYEAINCDELLSNTKLPLKGLSCRYLVFAILYVVVAGDTRSYSTIWLVISVGTNFVEPAKIQVSEIFPV